MKALQGSYTKFLEKVPGPENDLITALLDQGWFRDRMQYIGKNMVPLKACVDALTERTSTPDHPFIDGVARCVGQQHEGSLRDVEHGMGDLLRSE